MFYYYYRTSTRYKMVTGPFHFHVSYVLYHVYPTTILRPVPDVVWLVFLGMYGMHLKYRRFYS